MVKFKLRNRLHKVDNISGATVRLMDSKGAVALSAVSDGHGVASMDVKSLAAGSYSCSITAVNTFAGDVGTSLLATGSAPDRIYRPASLTVKVAGPAITSATSDDAKNAAVSVSGNLVAVDIQPVWMKSAQNHSRGSSAVSMIIVHHTGCNLGLAVSTFLVEKGPHYMIDTDGQIVKWVQDARLAWHAGESRWAGSTGHSVNGTSIGIEIVNKTGPYPEAQYASLLALLDDITTAFPAIDTWNIIGHSDVGTDVSGHLGRKSGDPGAQFEWSRLEDKHLGLKIEVGPASPDVYAGFFQAVPGGALQQGDHDSTHRFGGHIHKEITGTPVKELQEDLTAIGYALGTPDGDFALKTHRAVIAFQEHFFAGGRGHKAPDGRVDLRTAGLIRMVAAEAPGVAAAASP